MIEPPRPLPIKQRIARALVALWIAAILIAAASVSVIGHWSELERQTALLLGTLAPPAALFVGMLAAHRCGRRTTINQRVAWLFLAFVLSGAGMSIIELFGLR